MLLKYKILGKVNKGSYELSESFKNEFFQDEIKNIYFSDLLIDANFSSKNYELAAKGNYSINNLEFLKINFQNKFDNNLFNFLIDFDYKNNFELNLINYKKSKNSLANFLLEFETKDKFNIDFALAYRDHKLLIFQTITNSSIKKQHLSQAK